MSRPDARPATAARRTPRPATRPTSAAPSLRVERSLLREGHAVVAAVDEVGRGALAGPVSVGVVLVDAALGTGPQGVRDSKLLSPAARAALVPRIRRWAPAHAVGHADSCEVDDVGILGALRRAANRALASLAAAGWPAPDLVLLDGSHDWFTPPETVGLLGLLEEVDGGYAGPALPPVRTLVKADMRCSSVAAASVLAKVERDTRMVALAAEHPAYGWELNKGYSAPEHAEALRRLGPTPYHRRSWRLPGATPPAEVSQPGVVDLVVDDVAMAGESA